ncbi:AraC family transcriptional regulator [Nocardioides baculatus]|uniref:AraC family transcriptional regulator n=1 Tax=Nocardioides baculatus TaxID=2801337 RepID=A0ABS1LAC8_9ACTN|nr:AraC family transcriptional regulator [Nocardioides baculatus]MBL0748653.1 AraC family transcriptional regulator [Nocardioides baculatus]
MDGLSAMLDGPRARRAFLLRILLDPPWCVRLEDEAPLSVTTVVRGGMWVCPDDEEPVRLGAGDVVVWVGGDHWTIADDPGTPTQVVIHPGQVCTTVDGHVVAEEMAQGVRSWGNTGEGETVLLTGVYQLEGEVTRRLLRALPRTLVLRADELETPLVDLLAQEVVRDAPGQEAVLDRLLDLLLLTLLRTWFARSHAGTPGWYAAQGDAVVGPALRLMQHHPHHAWSVAELADRSGVSRAGFARRFTELVGEPPMAFLTQWRISLAADLLLEPDATVASVARRVGYATPFALSAAFKRERGISPRDHRRAGSQRASALPTARPEKMHPPRKVPSSAL